MMNPLPSHSRFRHHHSVGPPLFLRSVSPPKGPRSFRKEQAQTASQNEFTESPQTFTYKSLDSLLEFRKMVFLLWVLKILFK